MNIQRTYFREDGFLPHLHDGTCYNGDGLLRINGCLYTWMVGWKMQVASPS